MGTCPRRLKIKSPVMSDPPVAASMDLVHDLSSEKFGPGLSTFAVENWLLASGEVQNTLCLNVCDPGGAGKRYRAGTPRNGRNILKTRNLISNVLVQCTGS
jgi:hypothetical protein